MKRTAVLWMVSAILMWSLPAQADWDDNQPQKWVQYPDLTELGIDVNATSQDFTQGFILADDFECTEEGLITGIHIWGSWKGDYYPWAQDPSAVTFILSLHADIPASQSPTGYSMPGDPLWVQTFVPGDFTARRWNWGVWEGWLDPPDVYSPAADSVCWQYNFEIDPEDAFYQTGDPDQPVVYWLDVQAIPEDQETYFGWKTSINHWNDAAVWAWGAEPYSGSWTDLKYPLGHEQEGQRIDLAFVIVGEDQPDELDFGDAPDGAAAPGYPTLLMNTGANHVIAGPCLGDDTDVPDAEGDGQPDPDAKGDDNDGNDDEDGVQIPTLVQGTANTITYEVNGGGGVVEAWIDWDGDQTWVATEMIVGGSFLADGNHSVVVTAPLGSVVGQTFARFRISTAGGLPPEGPAGDGEVEDHEVFIEEEPDLWDFGDAPEIPGSPGYPTRLANNGARHFPNGPFFDDSTFLGLGTPDSDLDGQPDPNALGDDNDGNDDEEGVQIPVLVQGQTSTITFYVNGGGGVVEAWLDFNGDTMWQGFEQIVNGLYADGTHSVNITTPVTAAVGQTFARFRISALGGLTPVGPAGNGEVEDHEVWIEEDETYKWLQRPDLNETGIDVNATEPYILADDFLCTEPGWITEVHVWGSWMNDWIPYGEMPGAVTFTLSFHKDIPDSMSPTEYSMPGDPVWVRTFYPGEFTVQRWAENLEEGWMTPPDSYFWPGDTVCWLYSFFIDEDDAFHQDGTEAEPMVYWLDVQAEPEDADAWFGWKTSLDHWNDDAVWGDGIEPYFGPWFELIYPPNHEFTGDSIDLAFLLRAEPSTDVGESDGIRSELGLFQNVPNPFNPETAIDYSLAAVGPVSLQIYDVKGRLVRDLVEGVQSAGRHTATWDGKDGNGRELPTGVYFYRLKTGDFEATKKMLLLK